MVVMMSWITYYFTYKREYALQSQGESKMKKKDLLIIAAMSLGIGSGWMVLNENILAQDDGTVPIPVEETELPSEPAQDPEEKDEGSNSQDQSASDQTPSDPVQEGEDQTDPNAEQKEEPSLPTENKETDLVLQEKNEQPVVPAMAAASYQTVSYPAEADRTLNGVVIAAGQNVNMNDLLNKYDFFVIQADAGYGKTNPNFANLADQVVKKTDKKLMMYHEAQSGKDIGSAQMEAYSFYTAIRNYVGKGLPVLRFMNGADVGPNWADEFMDTLYGLSGVHGMVWTNQEKISSGDWSGYDEKKYPYTTEITKYETTESGWKEKIRPNHASEAVELYRMYNPNSGEHFYTSAGTERDSLVKAGWRYESIGWTTPVKTNGVAVYRLYNPNAGDHHYTVNEAERDMLIRKGWRYEGVGWYSDNQKQTAIWRAYNPNAKSGAHHFTASRSEYDFLTRIGWRGENIGFYGILPTLVPNSWPGANYIKGEYGYNTSGAKLSGVQKVNSSFYYFSGTNKAMKKGGGLTNVGNETIYVKADGTLQVGQLNTNGGWKWFEPATAYMAKGRFVDIPASYNSGKAKTVYYDGNGNMVHGTYTLGNYRFTANGEGIIVGSELLNLRNYYFMQTDPRWGNVYFGYLPLSSSGCVVTSAATIINYFRGTSYTPFNIANTAYRYGYLNSRADGSTSDIWRFIANTYNLSYQNGLNYNAAKQALIDGKIVTGAVGYSRWCPWYGATHEIYMAGYNNGKVTVYDPINQGNCGQFNLSDVLSAASASWIDTMDGGPFYAIGRK